MPLTSARSRCFASSAVTVRCTLQVLRTEWVYQPSYPLAVFTMPRRGESKRKGSSGSFGVRSEEHTSELQSRPHLVWRLLLEKKMALRHRPAARAQRAGRLVQTERARPSRRVRRVKRAARPARAERRRGGRA